MNAKLELTRRVLHPTLSALLAILFLTSCLYLVGSFFASWRPPPALSLLVVIAAAAEALVGAIVAAEHGNRFSRFRELAVLLVVCYPIVALFGGGPFLSRFAPTARHFAWLAVLALAWVMTFAVHRLLRGRESLLRAFRDLRGSRLRSAIIDRQRHMASIVSELRRARTVGGVLAFLLTVAVALASVFGLGAWSGVSPAGFVLFVLYTVIYLIVLSLINAFIDEYAANGEGIPVPIAIVRRRLIASLAVIALVAIAAFAVSRNRSVLSLDLIGSFFAWLGSLFQPTIDEPQRALPVEPPQVPLSPQLLQMIQTNRPEPSLLLQIIGRLLERTIVGLIAGAVVVFVFGPLFSREFRKRLSSLHPLATLRQAWQRVAARLQLWIRFLRWRANHRRTRERSGERMRESEVAADPEVQRLRKRRQTDRVVGAFLSVVRWARRRGINYRPSQGAGEFLNAVGERYPELADHAEVATGVFNEAKYSEKLVSFRRMRSYAKAVREITRSAR